jgi:hypothetical protein
MGGQAVSYERRRQTMTQMREPVILEAVRTPFAKAGGAFREVRPDALLAHTLDGLLERAGLLRGSREWGVGEGRESVEEDGGAKPEHCTRSRSTTQPRCTFS